MGMQERNGVNQQTPGTAEAQTKLAELAPSACTLDAPWPGQHPKEIDETLALLGLPPFTNP